MDQSQNTSLLTDRKGDGSAKISSYNALREKKRYDEERITDEESSIGFADGINDWADSWQAFHQAIIHFIVYMGAGIVFYSFILDTKWTVIDSVYFSVAVFTTVGYGDISPDSTVAGMVFTIFFALYGIIILGIFFGVLVGMAVKRHERRCKEIVNRTSDAYLDTLIAKPPDMNAEESTENVDHSFLHDVYKNVKEQRVVIVVLIVLFMPVIILEKWSIVQGLYWLIITSTTIGLGDEHPEHQWSKCICIFFIPLAVGFGGAFIGSIATSYMDHQNDAIEAQFMKRVLNTSALEKMDTNGDDTVSKDEFLVYMLKTLGKVEQCDIDKVLELFKSLDRDNSGELTEQDIGFIPNENAKKSLLNQLSLNG